jgi:hypothetical protein
VLVSLIALFVSLITCLEYNHVSGEFNHVFGEFNHVR